ncbi:hypothetical protein OH492_25210 [Vibrio chagasii]|nr:hypothetical protein [Vibrio chagasii]
MRQVTGTGDGGCAKQTEDTSLSTGGTPTISMTMRRSESSRRKPTRQAHTARSNTGTSGWRVLLSGITTDAVQELGTWDTLPETFTVTSADAHRA